MKYDISKESQPCAYAGEIKEEIFEFCACHPCPTFITLLSSNKKLIRDVGGGGVWIRKDTAQIHLGMH